MAEPARKIVDKKAAEKEAAAPPPPKKKGRLLLIVVLLLVVLGGGGAGGAWYWMRIHPSAKDGTPKEEKKVELAAIYVPLDPPFVVNFQSEQAARFLQVAVQLMTHDPATADLLKQHDPVIKNDLLLLFGGQKYEDLSTRAGKEKLQTDALAAVRAIVTKAGGKPGAVEALYFTSFVMQ
jgi:flagellar FliL protein